VQQLAQLGDRELLLGAQGVEPQAIFVAQQAKEVGAGLRLKHDLDLYVHAHTCNQRVT
jgi:hypothetical protein